ncbi:MAG: ABC transporter substrate-binding protein [Rhizobiales bacterium]|nr:ABC transporter substrate-binding protein [Hyphomicrobiales bacterium]
MSFFKCTCSILAAVAVFSVAPAKADLIKLTIPTLPAPSLGAFMGPVIKAQKFDEQNGLDLTFQQKPTATYRTDFAAGTDQLGGSGTLLADVALLRDKGLKVTYLFNVFDFWATVVVPQDSGIKAITDLKGKTLTASLPTANFPMFRYLATLGGLDMSSVQLRNADSSALVPTAKSKRSDAVQLWEPAYTILVHGNHDFRSIDVMSQWTDKTKENAFPYLGISAQQAWVDQNKAIIPKLFATYQKASEFIKSHPQEAAILIAKSLNVGAPVIQDLLSSDRLRLNLYWAADNKGAADAVFKAAISEGYLKAVPTDGILYDPRK